jgi:hypothetical protein
VIVPPGRSASSCSLAPGEYTFLVTKVSRDVRAPAETLAPKGLIAVER